MLLEKQLGYEGSSWTKMVQLMRNAGYSKPVNIEIATVVSAAPDLKIQLDADGLELEKDDLVVGKQLLRHERKVTLESASIDGLTKAAGDHAHGYDTIAVKEGKLTVESMLEPGTRVIVACLDEDMIYVVLDVAEWL